MVYVIQDFCHGVAGGIFGQNGFMELYTNLFFDVYSTTPFIMPTGDPVKKPEEGENTDIAIYVLSRVAGEGADRNAAAGDYYLKEDEHQMLADLCAYYKDVIVVVNAGGQVELSFMDEFENIKALLVIVQPGMEGGNAFADVISGKVNPSGKLVDSWAYKYEDYPSAATFSHNNGNVQKEFYEEGIYVGYRYFDTFGIPVRYGFGYGLSYTTFSMNDCTVERAKNNVVKISICVKNTGDMAGKEVVQVYVSLPGGRLEKEAHRLTAYAKTELLQPGEEQTVILEIPAARLTSYDEENAAWILEKGFYGISIGNSLESAELVGGVQMDETVGLEKVKNLFAKKEELNELSQQNGKTSQREAAQKALAAERNLPILEMKSADFVTKEIVYKKNSELADAKAMEFVNTLTVNELIDLAAGDPGKAQGGNLGAAGISVPGSAGETHRCAVDKGLASIVLADGPAGLRLMKYYHVDDGKIIPMPFEFSLEGGLFYDGPTIKHFACNNQEDNRMGSDSILSERAIRELYLKGFEIAVKESQPLSIMTSYNLINGVHAANNHDLCTDVARNEWGFQGAIMTDWTTTEVDDSCTASGCMRAGNDLVMPGCFGDHDNMKKELEEGTLKIEDLKACIARLVSVIWKSNQYVEK